MGDADTSRTSKGKGVLGGLVSSLKRVAGNKKDDEEPVRPRTGVSLRDRFSALRPSAAPTEPVPQKVSEDIPNPDSGKDVKVIHTSAVRSSGSVRFSDRIGVAVDSETEEGYDRKITFDDGRHAVIEEMPEDNGTIETEPKGRTIAEADAEATEEALPAAGHAGGIPDTIELDVIEDTESVSVPGVKQVETTVEESAIMKVQAEERKAPAEEKKPLFEIRRSPIEEKKAHIEEKKAHTEEKRSPAEEKKPLFEIRKAPVEEKKVPAEETAEEKKEIKAEKKEDVLKEESPKAAVPSPDDGFDEGYDFLPRRGRFFGTAKTHAPKETAPQAPPEAKKESTVLAQRLRTKHADAGPKKHTEVQIDGPVKHDGVSRTSLLDKVLRKKVPAKSVSDVILETERHTEPEAAPVMPEEIEECDAEVSAAAISAAAMPEERTFIDITDEIPAEIPIVAETERADEAGISDEIFIIEEAEAKEEITEEAVIEAAEAIPETAIEVITEVEAEVAEEVPEAVIEAAEEIPEAVVEVEAEVTEEIPETVIEVMAEKIPEAVVEVEAEVIAEAIAEVEAEVTEEVPETVIEVMAEEIPDAVVEVEAEIIPEVTTEVTEEIPEAVIEIAEEIPEAVVEVEAEVIAEVEAEVAEEVPETVIEVMAEEIPDAVVEVEAEVIAEVEAEVAEEIPETVIEVMAEEIPEAVVEVEAEVTAETAEEIPVMLIDAESIPEVEAEVAEEVPETPVEVTAEIPETVIEVIAEEVPETAVEVEFEAEVTEEVPEVLEVTAGIAEEIPEAVSEFFAEVPAEEVVPEVIAAEVTSEITEEAADAITAFMAEETAVEEETAVQPSTDHYLMEIEDDAPSARIIDTNADDIEESMIALLNGIAVDGDLIATEDVYGTGGDVCAVRVTEPISVTAANATAADISEALAICFSFRSEGLPPSPSASMRFVWGR